jgi:hypothetical protein
VNFEKAGCDGSSTTNDACVELQALLDAALAELEERKAESNNSSTNKSGNGAGAVVATVLVVGLLAVAAYIYRSRTCAYVRSKTCVRGCYQIARLLGCSQHCIFSNIFPRGRPLSYHCFTFYGIATLKAPVRYLHRLACQPPRSTPCIIDPKVVVVVVVAVLRQLGMSTDSRQKQIMV